jgi:hypothetical protein
MYPVCGKLGIHFPRVDGAPERPALWKQGQVMLVHLIASSQASAQNKVGIKEKYPLYM